MSAFTIAEARARKSESVPQFMAAYALGRSCGEAGVEPHLSGATATEIAGFIEGLASWRARTATRRDYVQGSKSHRAVAA
ncbi:hypothetical protein ACIQVR_23965 [Streptomyces xanthochromogenes]|uniref:hypothetical protein n=1 Tax=Streptomyces xanthochromogenes TaxID=67384 RepID=UPI00381FE060